MIEQEQLMDNLLNVDLGIIDVVRELRQGRNSEILKQKTDDLLKICDETVEKLMSFCGEHAQCDCDHNHQHD